MNNLTDRNRPDCLTKTDTNGTEKRLEDKVDFTDTQEDHKQRRMQT